MRACPPPTAPHLAAARLDRANMRLPVQAAAIESGSTDAIGRSLLHRHLTFHYTTDRHQLAVLTCVAEWEAGWVADVLPCYFFGGPPPKQARHRRARTRRRRHVR